MDLSDAFREIHDLLSRLEEECRREVETLRSRGPSTNGYDAVKDVGPHDLESEAAEEKKSPTISSVASRTPRLSCRSDVWHSMQTMGDFGSASLSALAFAKAVEEAAEDSIFELKSEWSKRPMDTKFAGFNDMITANSNLVDRESNEDKREIREAFHAHRSKSFLKNQHSPLEYGFARLVLNPASPKRVLWDLSGLLLISYDMVSIPLHLAFTPETVWFTAGMGWLTTLFWTLDMFASVFTGYYSDGKLVMQQKKIIVNYLRGWFWVDCIVVFPDWIMKLMQGSVSNAAGLARVVRMARIMRVLRLLRLLKLKRLFAIVYDCIDSEVSFIIFNLIKLLTMILFMNHVVACAWYGCGRLSKHYGAPKNWLQDVGYTRVWGSSLEWKYLTSLHWSITQFTPASMDISATNVPERLFSIVILFWALVALSSIIGSVSASMTALRNMSADENKQMWMLRRYLRQERIGMGLCQRIYRYLDFHQVEVHNRVKPSNVALLGALSEQFKAELQHEMQAPYLGGHPFFEYLTGDETMRLAMYRISLLGIHCHANAQEECAFSPGDEGRLMYFVKSGSYQYKLLDGNTLESDLTPKLWAAEAVLWTEWRHRGWMQASVISEALTILPHVFCDIFYKHPKLWLLAVNYGVLYVDYMNNIADLTDVVLGEHVWQFVQQANEILSFTPRRGSASIPVHAFHHFHAEYAVESQEEHSQPAPKMNNVNSTTNSTISFELGDTGSVEDAQGREYVASNGLRDSATVEGAEDDDMSPLGAESIEPSVLTCAAIPWMRQASPVTPRLPNSKSCDSCRTSPTTPHSQNSNSGQAEVALDDDQDRVVKI